jgi:hypothetical protein
VQRRRTGDIGRTLQQLLTRQSNTETRGQTVQGVVELAVVTVPGAESASITRIDRRGEFTSLAVTDESARRCDELQRDNGEGPCMDAIVSEPVVSLPDTRAEERWPRFAAAAAAIGVHSMLACRLVDPEGGTASLNLHAGPPHAFDDESMLLAAVTAAHASLALAAAGVNAALREAMDRRQIIGEACGVLMERHGLTSDAAFGLLVRASQQLNLKVRDIAEHVVATGAEPDTAG